MGKKRRLTGRERAELVRHAAWLIRHGVSRRKANAALKVWSLERFGVETGIGSSAHHSLFRERVMEIREQEMVAPHPYKGRLKGERGSRYDWLRRRHFVHDEARRLSHVREVKASPGVALMVGQRAALWDRFVYKAARRGWSKIRRRQEWRAMVAKWYRRNGYISKGVRGKRRASVWMWYKAVQSDLPTALQDETPRMHSRPPQRDVTGDAIEISRRLRDINNALANRDFRKHWPKFRRERERLQGELRRLRK